MADALKNLGTSRTIRVYVEGKKLGRDFTNVKNFSWEPVYYEGEDEYLGQSDVEPWQRPKMAQGSFDIEEQDATYIATIEQAKRDAELSGTRPKIEITESILNEGLGTTSKTRFPKCVLKPKWTVNSKGEKVICGYTFRSANPQQE